jgi:hypothetical protein
MFVGYQLKGSGDGDEGADESAVGAINRPLRLVGCTPLHMIEGALIDESSDHYQAGWT